MTTAYRPNRKSTRPSTTAEISIYIGQVVDETSRQVPDLPNTADRVADLGGKVSVLITDRRGRSGGVVRVSRVRPQRHPGYADMALLPRRHANLLDVHRPLPSSSAEEPSPLTEVDVTLLDLGPAREQDLEDRLEVINPQTGLPAEKADAGAAVLGLRLYYRLRYDEVAGAAERFAAQLRRHSGQRTYYSSKFSSRRGSGGYAGRNA